MSDLQPDVSLFQSHRRNPWTRNALAISYLAIAASLMPQMIAASTPGAFDQPLRKQIVNVGPPYYPAGARQKKLSCYFYPHLVVKEYDEGQKGAEWLAVVASEKGAPPKCTLSHESGERVVDGSEWGGYFKGVKGNLVFFRAADGTDGGMPFAIYDSKTGKKIFEDSAYESWIWSVKPKNSPFNGLRVYKTADGQITLKYLRVVGTDCDLHSEGVTCWEQVRANLQLKQTKMPVCSNYENISTRYSSSVAYPVETILIPEPVTKTTEGPIKCWPVD